MSLSILDDGSLAATLTDSLAEFDILGALVVTRQETSGPPYDPVITDVDYDCTGWVDDYDAASRAGSLVEQNDRKVFIVASSLAITPVPTNHVTVGGKTYSIVACSAIPQVRVGCFKPVSKPVKHGQYRHGTRRLAGGEPFGGVGFSFLAPDPRGAG